jgi:hypothetical protein
MQLYADVYERIRKECQQRRCTLIHNIHALPLRYIKISESEILTRW